MNNNNNNIIIIIITINLLHTDAFVQCLTLWLYIVYEVQYKFNFIRVSLLSTEGVAVFMDPFQTYRLSFMFAMYKNVLFNFVYY